MSSKHIDIGPTSTPIGSEARILVYQARVAAKRPVFHPGDTTAIQPPGQKTVRGQRRRTG